MPEPRLSLPDLDAYVRLGDIISELFELELLHMDDVIDRHTAQAPGRAACARPLLSASCRSGSPPSPHLETFQAPDPPPS